MTFPEVSTGVNAIPSNIIDAVELNERFTNIRDIFGVSGYYGKGWIPVEPSGGFEFHATNAIKTISDINLTGDLRVGDKITWTHTPTGGDRFGIITRINHNSTVANRTYIEIFGFTVLDESVVANTVGISRVAFPAGWISDYNKIHVSVGLSANQTTTTATINFNTRRAATINDSHFNITTQVFTAPFDMVAHILVTLRIRSPINGTRYGVKFVTSVPSLGDPQLQMTATGTTNQALPLPITISLRRGETVRVEALFDASVEIDSNEVFSRMTISGTFQ